MRTPVAPPMSWSGTAGPGASRREAGRFRFMGLMLRGQGCTKHGLKMITVSAPVDEDDEERLYVAIAYSSESALQMVREYPHDREYPSFKVVGVIEGSFGGPERVLGYCGQGPFSWK